MIAHFSLSAEQHYILIFFTCLYSLYLDQKHRILKFQDSQLRMHIITKPNSQQKWSDERIKWLVTPVYMCIWKILVGMKRWQSSSSKDFDLSFLFVNFHHRDQCHLESFLRWWRAFKLFFCSSGDQLNNLPAALSCLVVWPAMTRWQQCVQTIN